MSPMRCTTLTSCTADTGGANENTLGIQVVAYPLGRHGYLSQVQYALLGIHLQIRHRPEHNPVLRLPAIIRREITMTETHIVALVGTFLTALTLVLCALQGPSETKDDDFRSNP